MLLYIDDLLIASFSKKEIEKVFESLKVEFNLSSRHRWGQYPTSLDRMGNERKQRSRFV